MQDYSKRGIWDANFDSGHLIKQVGPMVQLHYINTKKVAVVSSRDQYVLIFRKEIPAECNPSGKRAVIIAAKSKEFAEYPPTPGIVRA